MIKFYLEISRLSQSEAINQIRLGGTMRSTGALSNSTMDVIRLCNAAKLEIYYLFEVVTYTLFLEM